MILMILFSSFLLYFQHCLATNQFVASIIHFIAVRFRFHITDIDLLLLIFPPADPFPLCSCFWLLLLLFASSSSSYTHTGRQTDTLRQRRCRSAVLCCCCCCCCYFGPRNTGKFSHIDYLTRFSALFIPLCDYLNRFKLNIIARTYIYTHAQRETQVPQSKFT